MPKTPDEIKKGLECCGQVGRCIHGCPYYINNNIPSCTIHKSRDALALIQQLEAERDAAVKDLQYFSDCRQCSSYESNENCGKCRPGHNGWQWRGVQKEE